MPVYTDAVGSSSTDGEGNLLTPPTVEVPAYTDEVGTSSTDGEGNLLTPPTVEVPAYTGSVNGISEECQLSHIRTAVLMKCQMELQYLKLQ